MSDHPTHSSRGPQQLDGLLSKPERIILLILATLSVSVDLIVVFTSHSLTPLQAVVSICTTLTFTLFLWSSLIATTTLGLFVVLSMLVGSEVPGLLAGSLAAVLVLRLGSTPLIIGYAGGLLVANAAFAYMYASSETTPSNIATFLTVASLSGGVGFAIRAAYARGTRLERELAMQAEHEREAVLAERRRIAGELHDNIAHHLTVVALHAQMLDDEACRSSSQAAIRTASRKALSDLRFVIELVDDAPSDTRAPSGNLASAIDEARGELEAAGRTVTCTGNPKDVSLPHRVEFILARIVRESATNIMKHAGPGEVLIDLCVNPNSALLQIRSPLPSAPRKDLPSSGTGLDRMAERVLGVRGQFTATPDGDSWVVRVRTPTA